MMMTLLLLTVTTVHITACARWSQSVDSYDKLLAVVDSIAAIKNVCTIILRFNNTRFNSV